MSKPLTAEDKGGLGFAAYVVACSTIGGLIGGNGGVGTGFVVAMATYVAAIPVIIVVALAVGIWQGFRTTP